MGTPASHPPDDAEAEGRPWWASPDGAALDPSADPLRQHLAGRRGEAGTPEPVQHTDVPVDRSTGADQDTAPEQDGGSANRASTGHATNGPASGRDGDEHDPTICGICPICRGWEGLRQRHPEVATHLAEGARHLALALQHLAASLDDADQRREDRDRPSAPPHRHDFVPIVVEDGQRAAQPPPDPGA